MVRQHLARAGSSPQPAGALESWSVTHAIEVFGQHWGYLAIFVVTLISAVGPPIGAEASVIYGGVLASGQVHVSGAHPLTVPAVIGVAVVGELVGSYLGYGLGYLGGRPLVDRVGKYVLLTHRDLDKAEAWFARRGEPAVLVVRLIPLLRSFISIAAGLGEMAMAKFTVFTIIGSAIFVSALAELGYSLGSSYARIVKDFSFAGYVAAAVFVIVVVLLFAHRVRAMRLERELEL